MTSDIVPNLSPPPDKTLFPQGLRTPWIKPGRAVWRYLDGGDPTLEGIKDFSRMAGELGFEYQVVEGQWQRWTEAQLRVLAGGVRVDSTGAGERGAKIPKSQGHGPCGRVPAFHVVDATAGAR